MPVMSGFKEMCYKIKNCLELAYVPVVLLKPRRLMNIL